MFILLDISKCVAIKKLRKVFLPLNEEENPNSAGL